MLQVRKLHSTFLFLKMVDFMRVQVQNGDQSPWYSNITNIPCSSVFGQIVVKIVVKIFFDCDVFQRPPLIKLESSV